MVQQTLQALAGVPTDNLGVVTKAYVDSPPRAGALLTTGGTMTGNIPVSGTVDFGTSGNRINTVFATTFNGTLKLFAQYADLAENFV